MSEGLKGLFALLGDGSAAAAPSYDENEALVASGGDGCSYTKLRRSKCAMERNPETGKMAKKCEKTEQLLRRCAGRPLEVVESKTEWTEEDVSTPAIIGHDDVHVFEETPLGWNRFFNDQDFNGPVLARLFENPHEFSDRLLDALEDFLHAAEETASELLGQFPIFSAEGSKDSEPFKGLIDRIPGIFSRGSNHETRMSEGSSLPGEVKTTPHAAKFSEFSKGFKEV